MANKYLHRRISPEEFTRLRAISDMRINDFLYVTGRNGHQLDNFLSGTGSAWTPTMGDVLILELACDEGMIDRMMEIADKYSLGPRAEKQPANGKGR